MINYTATGTDATGRDFEITGIVAGVNPLDPEVFQLVGRAAFQQLTQGKAIYGHPGERGCQGPYTLKMLTLVAT